MDISHGPSSTAKRHGMGKGLMTVWRATNPDGGDLPNGLDVVTGNNCLCPLSGSRKPLSQSRRTTRQETLAVSFVIHNFVLCEGFSSYLIFAYFWGKLGYIDLLVVYVILDSQKSKYS